MFRYCRDFCNMCQNSCAPSLRHLWKSILSFLLGLIAVGFVRARYDSVQAATQDVSFRPFIPHGLSGDYVVFETSKSAAVVHTKDKLQGRHATYYFGYRKQIALNWIMGLGLGYRSFTKFTDQDQSELAFLTVLHESYYIVRMHHPMYLLLGPNLLYLLPHRRSYFPPDRDATFETEFGTGFSAAFVWVIDPSYLFTLRLERWRGTRTDQFHALTTSVGLNFRL